MRKYIISSIIFHLSLIQPSPVYAQTILKQDGKFGISDEKGNVIVKPFCDSAYAVYYETEIGFNGSKIKKPAPVVIYALRKNNKYAYAIKKYWGFSESRRGVNSARGQTYDIADSARWVVSAFEYDTLYKLGYYEDEKNSAWMSTINPIYKYEDKTCTAFKRAYWLFAYKKGNKYGVISVDDVMCEYYRNTDDGVETERRCYSIDNIAIGSPQYSMLKDYIVADGGNSIMQFILTKDSLDKYGIIEPTYQFEIAPQFDGIPEYAQKDEVWHKYRYVKKGDKWGLIDMDLKNNKFTYIIPCECEFKIKNANDKLFICEKTDKKKVVVYDIVNKKKIELPSFNKPLYNFKLFSVDTVPDKNQQTHKTYLMLSFGSYDNDSYNKGSELYFIDIENQKIKAVYNDTSVNYECFYGKHGAIVMKKINTQKGFIYEFIDWETGKTVFSLPPEKKEYAYKILVEYTGEYSCDYLVVHSHYHIKPEFGADKYGNIGYYDYRKKKYKKGKCPAC